MHDSSIDVNKMQNVTRYEQLKAKCKQAGVSYEGLV